MPSLSTVALCLLFANCMKGEACHAERRFAPLGGAGCRMDK